jgi:hypothetical protein
MGSERIKQMFFWNKTDSIPRSIDDDDQFSFKDLLMTS